MSPYNHDVVGVSRGVHTSMPVLREQVAEEAHDKGKACTKNDTQANHAPFCLLHCSADSITEGCSTPSYLWLVPMSCAGQQFLAQMVWAMEVKNHSTPVTGKWLQPQQEQQQWQEQQQSKEQQQERWGHYLSR